MLFALDFEDDGTYDDSGLSGREFYAEVWIWVCHEYTLGGTDYELCEFKQIVKWFYIWIKYGEWEKWGFSDCAKSQLARFSNW